MSVNEERSPPKGLLTKSTSLQEKVAQFYYSFGLVCGTYPTCIISIAIAVTLLCCYPLVNLPVPGSLPTQLWVPGPNHTTSGQISEQPWCYVQQVVLKTAVVPWSSELILGDAFRAPLYEAFKLLDMVRNYQDVQSGKTLGHFCLHVEAIKKTKDIQNVLPEYSCLILSPANFWQQDVQLFIQDANIINTIYNHQNLQKGKTSIAEMLFGMLLSDTGFKRYPLRKRQRIMQYAITLFFKEYDERFISGLRNKLQSVYDLHQNVTMSQTDDRSNLLNNTIIIQYPDEINYYEFVPLLLAFLLFFAYYYFSIRKIELVKSKIGMAFTVIVMVFACLNMALGLCFFFGLTLSRQGKEIFPYLVLLVGIENVLVLTKSVVTTQPHLDVKIRVAQGLSKEGWSITKNLLIEITILTIGIFTFVPAIQEFCIFAIVSLLTDFFLQMLFFSTILGVDTRRVKHIADTVNDQFRTSLYQNSVFNKSMNSPIKGGMIRSKSHPRLNSVHANVVASQVHNIQEKKIPKRLRLVNVWARTRFFQKSFMMLMVIWIAKICYNSGLIQSYFIEMTEGKAKWDRLKGFNVTTTGSTIDFYSVLDPNESHIINLITQQTPYTYFENHTDEVDRLRHSDYGPWLKLSTQHWPSILKKYNFSISGKNIMILPPIKISYAIPPEQAIVLRNSEEKNMQKFQWQSLALALDPIDFNDMERDPNLNNFNQSERPLYPTSPMELLLIAILCLISVIVLAYAVVVLYKCICSRNYAEWRASWIKEKTEEADVPVMLEAMPLILQGHDQDIECLATDGFNVVSSCLGGCLKVWDSTTGELLSSVDRYSYFNKHEEIADYENNLSDYESDSELLMNSPSGLKDKINFNFTDIKYNSSKNKAKFDFTEPYRLLYQSDSINKIAKVRWRNRKTVSQGDGESSINKQELHNCSDEYQNVARTLSDSGLSASGVNGIEENKSICCSVSDIKPSPIWCVDYMDDLIALGCGDGHLEFWEGTTGKFKHIYDDGSCVGVTSLKIIGCRVIVARLYGAIDLLQLQSYNHGRPIDWNFSCAYRRTHVRSGSTGSISDCVHGTNQNECKEDVRCVKILSIKAHQQPIMCLDCEGSLILSGSQDHTLRVFRLEDGSPLYTLHGHCGPITCLFIDRINPATSGSGSQNGMLCVWDLLTGTCMYSIQAHDGSVISLTYSASYVISLGSDERLCVWERFQGHLLNTIYLQQTLTNQVLMLTSHLVVTARSGNLAIHDVRTGECVRTIMLGTCPYIFIKQLVMLRDAVVCDFGNQLRIVRFPLITHKFD